MKRLAIVLALATASGCAHKQLTNQQVAKVVVYGGGVVAVVVLATLYCHQECNIK